MAGKLGKDRMGAQIISINSRGNDKVELAISAPQEVEVLRRELVASCNVV
jgi:sRNA-binding carbon storage regulator CsrA